MKRVLIKATGDDNRYPTICGEHDFTNLDEALEFAHYGAKGLGYDGSEYVVDMEPVQRWYPGIDVIIEIYDDYRE